MYRASEMFGAKNNLPNHLIGEILVHIENYWELLTYINSIVRVGHFGRRLEVKKWKGKMEPRKRKIRKSETALDFSWKAGIAHFVAQLSTPAPRPPSYRATLENLPEHKTIGKHSISRNSYLPKPSSLAHLISHTSHLSHSYIYRLAEPFCSSPADILHQAWKLPATQRFTQCLGMRR